MIYAFCSIAKSLSGPSFKPLLAIVKAKLLPTLAYATEVQYGRKAAVFERMQIKTYKIVFGLPRNSSPAQIRLEFGFLQQRLARMYATTKL